MGNCLSIDLSLRTTACVLVDVDDFSVKDMLWITSDSKTIHNEELVEYNTQRVLDFAFKYEKDIDYIVIEGLSFNSLSSDKDLIAGNFWHLRVELHQLAMWNVGIVPVTAWRKSIIDKNQMADLLSQIDIKAIEDSVPELDLEGKKPLVIKRLIAKRTKSIKTKISAVRKKLVKDFTCNALPFSVKLSIEKYIKANKLSMSIFDNFADAYFIAKYRIDLERE